MSAAEPLPGVPRAYAKGKKRACGTCRAPRRVLVRAQRTDHTKSGVRFAGYCETCGNAIGMVAASKVDDVDQVALELALDAFDPEQAGLFTGAQQPRLLGDDA